MTSSRNILSALALCAPLAALAAPTATNLDPLFALAPNANVFESDTVKHATVGAEALPEDSRVAWFSFSGQAGQQLWADHDDGINGDTLTDSVLSLFNADGQLLAVGDDSDFDPGSLNTAEPVSYNAFLGAYTLPTTGVYYLALSAAGNGADETGCELTDMLYQPGTFGRGGSQFSGCSLSSFSFTNPSGEGSYTLHVSLTDGLAVPEPGSLALAGLGLAGLMARRGRRR